jgi:diaminopimelate decarboxylase
MPHSRLDLFPITARVEQNRLTVDGLDLAELAQIHGTPLYLYDQASMDQAVDEYRAALAQAYPGQSGITYAGKAFLCVAVARWAAQQGLWIDCTGEGELHIAQQAGVPAQQILVHGVNKSPADLAAAVALAGTIVVDNLSELKRLILLHENTQKEGRPFPDLWLRMRPGLSVETHSYRQTGQEESKFGMSRAELTQAVKVAQAHNLPLTGLHFHQGSH